MTKNELKVLDILNDLSLYRPPTMNTIVDKVGISGNKSLLGILKRLEDKGLIFKQDGYFYPTKMESASIAYRSAVFSGTN